tara:strand:- start:16 stop:648 length:633 start_codon:yes stop_codon:yes gene_type:complete
MKVYCGATGSKKTLKYMWEKNYGLMLNPLSWKYGNAVPWRYWALDNGAYKAYTDGVDFDGKRFLKTIYEKLPKAKLAPDFIVVPDKVGAGLDSLKFSLAWHSELKYMKEQNWYLAVQDGMETLDVEKVIQDFDGIFVGGTVKWKLSMGERWVKLAHTYDKPCHIGRVGVFKRIMWAKRILADSIDSTNFARNRDGFRPLESSQLQTILVK